VTVDIFALRTIEDYVPDPTRTLAPQILQWIDAYLLQFDGANAGQPLQLSREQARLLARWYEIDERGRFVFRRGVVRRMKGHGKTPLAATLAAVELCGPCRFDGFDAGGKPVAVPHPAPWIVAAAVSIDQTRNVMRALHGMFSDAAIDAYRLELGRLLIHSRNGQVEAVTSSPRVIEGARSSFVIADEVQEWLENNRGVEMAAAVRRNVAKLGTARTLELANAHRPGEGSVAEGTYVALCEAGGALPGVMYDSLQGPPVRDLADTDAVRSALEVARGDSVWLDVDRLAAEIADPATLPSIARRYYLNQIVEAEDERWMERELWESAARPGVTIPRGAQVTVGFDGSRSGDWTAAVACWVRKDGTRHLETVKVWKPAGPEDPVPVLAVEDELRACFERWSVREVIADPTYWERSLQILEREHRGRVVAFPPQRVQAMVAAAEGFMQALQAGTLTHDGDPDLTQAAMNAVAKESKYGAQLQKRRRAEKIDPVIAALMAFARSLHYQHSAATCYSGWDVLYGASDEDEGLTDDEIIAELRREAAEDAAAVLAEVDA
jgi:hypothetical protein